MFSGNIRLHAARSRNTAISAPRITRGYSAAANSARRPSYRDLLKAPIFKSIFLTVVFGLAVIELMRNRKELEALVSTHEAKFALLDELKAKLRRGDHVDVVLELKMANTLTKYRYNTVTDIQLDEQLNELLKMAEESPLDERERDEIEEERAVGENAADHEKAPLDTKKFM